MRRSNLLRGFLAAGGLLAFLMICPNRALSQGAGSGTITGSVTDASGAVVPAANVTIRNTDTGIERKTQTSDAGVYTAAFLPPGHYSLEAGKPGFASVLHKDLMLQVGQTLAINVSLSVQGTQQEVTVTGAAPLVDAEKTENSQVVGDQAVSNLPVYGRRWDAFVLLTPNVTADGTNGMVSYRGISGLYNGNSVDGANNNQAFMSEARARAFSGAYVYSLDSVREYQVAASNYSAELGQAAGGVVNAVTKSGTNDLHGDLFYYLRYPSWAALDPYLKTQGILFQPVHQWQQFGVSVGGPIVRDKLFFFATYDGSRKVNPISYTSSTKASTLTCPALVTATQCTNAQNFLASLVGTWPRGTTQDVFFGKLDSQLNQRNHVSASFDWMNNKGPNSYATSPTYNNDSVQDNASYGYHERIFVTNWDSTLSATTVNNLRFQWGRDFEFADSNAPAPYVSLSNITNYGEAYFMPRTAEPDEHRIQIADTLSKVHGRHSIKAGVDVNFIHEVMINLFYGTGRYNYSGSTGQATFNSWVEDLYGINVGDGLTGRHYTSFTQADDPITHVGKDDFYDNDYAAFFEDSWKVNPHLTLNLGLRWDLTTIPQPPQPNTATPLTTLYTSTIHIPKDQFAPRIGLAWQMTPKTVLRTGWGLFFAKTTNTTYYNTRVENGVYQQTFNCAPTTCPSLTFPNVIWTPPGPTMTAPFAGALVPQVVTFAPPAATGSARGLAPDWVNPRVHEGDVTVERELPGGFGLSGAYVFSRALHLPIFPDANLAPTTNTKSWDILSPTGSVAQTYTTPYYSSRLNPAFGILTVGYSVVNSWYNSAVLTLRHPMRHGLEFTANYTLSKAMDGGQVSGTSGTFAGTDDPLDPYNLKQEWGASELDTRNRFVGNLVWSPTIGSLQNKAAKFLVNGWAFSTIVTESNGHPQQANVGGSFPLSPDSGLTGGVSYNASTATGRVGWLPRDPYVAPGLHTVDLRVGRQFPFGERFKLTLLAEAFNLFNHTNVASVNTTAYNYLAAGASTTVAGTSIKCPGPNACMVPNGTATSLLYMTPTATSSLLFGPRQIQISAKLFF
jgi:hypothetical protein